MLFLNKAFLCYCQHSCISVFCCPVQVGSIQVYFSMYFLNLKYVYCIIAMLRIVLNIWCFHQNLGSVISYPALHSQVSAAQERVSSVNFNITNWLSPESIVAIAALKSTQATKSQLKNIILLSHFTILFLFKIPADVASKHFRRAEVLYYKVLESVIEQERRRLGDTDLSVRKTNQIIPLF